MSARLAARGGAPALPRRQHCLLQEDQRHADLQLDLLRPASCMCTCVRTNQLARLGLTLYSGRQGLTSLSAGGHQRAGWQEGPGRRAAARRCCSHKEEQKEAQARLCCCGGHPAGARRSHRRPVCAHSRARGRGCSPRRGLRCETWLAGKCCAASSCCRRHSEGRARSCYSCRRIAADTLMCHTYSYTELVLGCNTGSLANLLSPPLSSDGRAALQARRRRAKSPRQQRQQRQSSRQQQCQQQLQLRSTRPHRQKRKRRRRRPESCVVGASCGVLCVVCCLSRAVQRAVLC